MTGNDDPPELQQMLRGSAVLTETEDNVLDLGEGISMISFGYSNPTPWNTPRELDDDELERRIEKLARQVDRPERAVFNLHVPPARTSIDKAPALDSSLKPIVKGGAMVMQSVGSEGVRRVLERHQPMLGAARAHPRVARRGPARRHAVHQPGQRVRRRDPARCRARTRWQARRPAIPAPVRLSRTVRTHAHRLKGESVGSAGVQQSAHQPARADAR